MQEYDNRPTLCRATDKNPDKAPTLPRDACLPINRCNLPALILGGITFQHHPTPLKLDGVEELHRDLFHRLNAIPDARRRGKIFQDYVTVHFRLEHLDEAGLGGHDKARANANYIRMIRGWSFDADSREGAVMKAWTESRFGLLPRHHGKPIRNPSDHAYRRYMEMRAQGLYGTNALESQLDLVYAYCQYEFARQRPETSHLTLYRGINRLGEHERLAGGTDKHPILLLNNLNSFTRNRDRAGEFGDYILTLQAPVAKILFHCQLLPGVLKGEDEFLLIGGVYEAECAVM
ncbi:MAG: NAD(+)--dinitrogen-reductase ADP-D-ribosyltransferase [Zoogloeaceae bacterium]|jgi:NAD+--dinitrogen-reductase ADP-D-ribosyltransferase|nr:NAD(+)--dinitrogen-reductase ADP-D-ribosyltransferase [Zoogloeaceae bacterium]